MKSSETLRIFRCSTCGNIILMLEDSGIHPVCCGKPMELLEAKTSDELHEKHVPVIIEDGCCITVTVGTAAHPMLPAHYIQWIILETTNGFHLERLNSGDDPAAHFKLCGGEEILAAFAYCNIHGLWKGTCCPAHAAEETE